MQSFALPTVTRSHPPEFSDARAARDWVDGIDSAQPLANQGRLLGQFNLLNRHALPAGERLRIAEELRETVLTVQSATASRFVGRPLPLSAGEQAAFDANQGLWDTLATAYLHCLAAALDGDGAVVGQAGLIAHRALGTLATMQLDALRTAHLPGPGYWRRVNSAFDAAERLGVAERSFRDSSVHDERPVSVRALYVLCVLLHTSSPFGLGHRALRVIHRWLGKWSGKVDVTDAPVPGSALPPLMTDLNDDAPVALTPRADSRLRWLVLDALSHSIRKRLGLLAQGETPLALRLGDELGPAQAQRLLKHLHTHCCRGGHTRSEPRRPLQQIASAVIGMPAVQQFLAGSEDIVRFGAHGDTRECSYRVEDWRILDNSPTGLRMSRRASADGARVSTGMLLVVRPDDTERFMLAHVCWVMTAGGELQMGISMIAGTPRPVTLACAAGDEERSAKGLLMPEVARIGQPECVALPTGWYRKSRDLTLAVDGTRRRVRMIESIERGSDFDLARIEPAT